MGTQSSSETNANQLDLKIKGDRNVHRLWRVCWTRSRDVFDEIKESTPILQPVVFAICGLTLGMLAIDILLSLAVLRTSHPMVSVLNNTVFYVLGIVCVTGIWWLLTSTYYFGIARLFKIRISWRNWFGFSCWSSIPLVTLPVFVGIAWLVQVYPQHGAWNDPWYVEFISACCLIFPFVWCMRVTAQGLHSWTAPAGRGNVYWRLVAIVPYGLLLFYFMFWSAILMSVM